MRKVEKAKCITLKLGSRVSCLNYNTKDIA